jgi:hypothetical protein
VKHLIVVDIEQADGFVRRTHDQGSRQFLQPAFTISVRGPSHGVPCFIKARTLVAKFFDHSLDIHSLSLD